ncbi:hypothetical protein PILCRDRAFT_710708 [Piloderma croceum F 1598]|uniref:Uncharacterized protein n=1 Tax=Piloderma croceum (strain F 1598) TaxID=765440 RepID=A0A0C3F2P7_PILCF|nr:hypothetical protein PILCRDRAFT_710708 [Piloderma croceum F 1598]
MIFSIVLIAVLILSLSFLGFSFIYPCSFIRCPALFAVLLHRHFSYRHPYTLHPYSNSRSDSVSVCKHDTLHNTFTDYNNKCTPVSVPILTITSHHIMFD